MDALESVWALETRLYGEKAKERIASDLSFLERLVTHYNHPLPILETIASSHHKLARFKEEEATRDRIIAIAPCSSVGGNSASRILGERYWLAHGGSRKSPLKLPLPEARTYYAFVLSGMQACPQWVDLAMWSRSPTVLRLGFAGGLTTEEFAAEEAYYQELWPRLEPFYRAFALQEPGYIFPFIKLRTGQPFSERDLEAIRSVMRTESRSRANVRDNGWSDEELPERRELNRVGHAVIDTDLAALLAEGLIRLGKVPEAGTALGGLSDQIQLLQAHVTDKKAWGVQTALVRYLNIRSKLASNSWDAYAFLKAAALFQPADSDSVDHDKGIDATLLRKKQELGIKEETINRQTWQGGAESARILGLAETTVAAANREERWHWLAKPLPLPAMTLRDLQGRTFTLENMKGKTVLLNIWATWCGPCQLEVPLVSQIAAKAAGNPKLLVVAMSMDTDQSAVGPYLSKRSINLPLVLMGEEYFRNLTQDATAKREMQMAVPQTWLVNPKGEVIAVTSGFDGSVEPGIWVDQTFALLEQTASKQ